MDLRSLVQDILSEVSPNIINFQIGLHLFITWVRSSDYFRFIESLRTCIMASHQFSNINRIRMNKDKEVYVSSEIRPYCFILVEDF